MTTTGSDGEDAARDAGAGWRAWTRRRARRLVWAGVVAAYLVLAFGWLWRAGAGEMGELEARLAFGALVVQTFAFHGGLVLLAAAGAAGLLRMPRAVLALLPALAWTLGPAAWLWARPGAGAPGAGEPVLTVMSANVLYRNEGAAALLAQVDAADPDLVLVQEFAPGVHEELERGLRARYPHARVWPQSDAFGQAVFSRLAFTEEPTLWWGGERAPVPQLEFEVEFGGLRVAVKNVHTLPPVGREYIGEQRALVRALGARVEGLMASRDAPDAVIVAGDFNAPFASGHLRELRAAGLRDTHGAAGRGRGGTWPERPMFGLAPRVDLDHVLWRGGLRGVGASVGEPFGSDHRPVVARFIAE